MAEDDTETPGGPAADRPHKIHDNLARSRIAPDLRDAIADEARGPVRARAPGAPISMDVILEFNTDFPGGARAARHVLLTAYLASPSVSADIRAQAVVRLGPLLDDGVGTALTPRLADATGQPFAFRTGDEVDVWKSLLTDAYAFGRLTLATITAIAGVAATLLGRERPVPLLHKVWRDHPIEASIYESVRTIKCDAARAAFGSAGHGIVWAVADTGVDATHPHFQTYDTLSLPGGLQHCDFTQAYPDAASAEAAALIDTAGHGSHVAGIIAGACRTAAAPAAPGGKTVPEISISHTVRTDDDQTHEETDTNRAEVSGIAPQCKILSLKVLTDARSGVVSNLLAAIGYVQRANNNGRDIKIHGLNLSLGYPFNPAWFAAGQSPLCVEVDRLVRCGVSVVVAAGNAGYGRVSASTGTSESAALTCTIADPGNAELAITVGSTHRDHPHLFGVSYFSAKGPTADGRMKPDLVAPGERIVSCAAPSGAAAAYREDSGTSMAAPHVSAAIAAFLSVRAEFIGRPLDVKNILIGSAMTLQRRPEFQGAGLVDLMKALQSV
jgi:hypothetical protein